MAQTRAVTVVANEGRSGVGFFYVFNAINPGDLWFIRLLGRETTRYEVMVGVLRGPDGFLFCLGNHCQINRKLLLRLTDSHPVPCRE